MNKTSGIAFIAVGLCFAVIFKDQPIGLIAAVLFIIAGIMQMVASRKKGS